MNSRAAAVAGKRCHFGLFELPGAGGGVSGLGGAAPGGTNSLHTNALDEVLALPSEQAAEIAVRTQQVIMEETGVVNVADPLGGSWYLEALTDRLEAEAEAIFGRILAVGPEHQVTGRGPP